MYSTLRGYNGISKSRALNLSPREVQNQDRDRPLISNQHPRNQHKPVHKKQQECVHYAYIYVHIMY